MRAKSDLTDQSECGLPYSVFGELAVKLVFTEAADQAQLVSENSLQCYKESVEPTAERIVRIRSMQPGARDRLTRATHRAQHPGLRAGAGVSSPST